MSEQPIIIGNPDASTVALIFSWLNQNSEIDQDAEGDYLNIYVADQGRQRAPPRILLGGAASGQTPHPIFWRTRQVQQHISSREVQERYRAVRAAAAEAARCADEKETPEFPMEPSCDVASDDNCQWILDSDSNSVQELSQADSAIYKSSSSSDDSDTGTVVQKTSEDQLEPEAVVYEATIDDEIHPAEEPADVLSNPLLQAFILDLDDVEMTPMLHMVANMMTNMYFDAAETEVVRHYLLHKVEATIDGIQNRMDRLHTEIDTDQPLDMAISEVEDETNSQSDDLDETSTPTMTSESEVSPLELPPPVPAPKREMLVTKVQDEEESEPQPELLVEPVEDNEGVTEASMKVVTQIMAMKSGRKRKKLIKKSHLGEKELAVVKYFEQTMRIKSSWWSCCGAARKTDIPY